MMKLVNTVFAIVMIVFLSACGNSESSITDKSLYEHGQDVVSMMVEATRSEGYAQAYTSNSEIAEIVQGIGEGDFTNPKAVYSITVSDEALLRLAKLANLDGISEKLQDTLKSKVLGAMITQVNGLDGVDDLAASSVCVMEKTFVKEDVKENQIYIYTYDNAKPVAVTFTVGEDGSISASGTFVMYDEFTCDSAEEIEAFFSYLDVEVNEVK